MKYTLAQNVWDTFESVTIDVPDEWNLALHGMKGDDMKQLTDEEIRYRIVHPIGMPPIEEFARGKQKVCIVFDDMARATPTKQIAHIVLEELYKADIRKEQIVFLCAQGNHGAHNRDDFEAKLGPDIMEDFNVFNHNPFFGLVKVGVNSRGADITVNREFYNCDCRIGIGGITPHLDNAFGGGYKIVFPGLAGFDTTVSNHDIGSKYRKDNNLDVVGAMGHIENTGMREDVESMGRMIDNFFKIDVVYNSRLEILNVTAGDPIKEYYEGVKFARESYATNRVRDKDIVIANINAKAGESFLGIQMGLMGVKESGGILIIVNFNKRGIVTHYLLSQFGRDYGGPYFGGDKVKNPVGKKFIYFSPYADKNLQSFMGADAPGLWTHCRTWSEVLDETARYGPGTEAALMTDATIQYYVD